MQRVTLFSVRNSWLMLVLTLVWVGMSVVLPTSAQSARDRRDPVRVKSYPPAALAFPGVVGSRNAPANDNFANALSLGSTLPVTQTVSSFEDASIEVGEPVPTCQDSDLSSIWFSFTPAADGLVTLDGFGSQPDDLDIIGAVYTGASLGGLTSVACNDDFDLEIAVYPFIKAIPMTAGVTYYIQIIEFINFESPVGSSVTVTLRQTPSAFTVTVDTTADTVDLLADDGLCADVGGFCSLRAAIMESNRALPWSVITVPAGNYVRTLFEDADEGVAREGDLDITESMTLTGAGAGQTIVDANTFDGVFEIFDNSVVSLTGMTIRGGNRGYAGGGIRMVNAVVTLDDLNILDNIARDGSGVYVRGGTVVITDSSIVNNTTNFNDPGFGGGLGVFYNFENDTPTGGQATLTNVTLSGNLAQRGGGIAVGDLSSITLEFVTVADNRAMDRGGGFYLSNNDDGFGDGTAALGRSLIADNNSDTDAAPDCRGGYFRNAKNLIGSAVGCTIDVSDIGGLNPQLRPLELRGPGYTYTHGLKNGSSAIDALPNCGVATTDQRGVARPLNDNCDIGALERNSISPLPISLTAPLDDAYVGSLASLGTFTWTQSNLDVYGYAFTITNIGVSPAVEVLNILVRGETACASNVCSYTPTTSLPENYYEWTVNASYDGDSATPAPRSFQIDAYAALPNLVKNPSFESKNTDWKRVNITGDTAKCTTLTVTIPTSEGTCAFLFKGSSAENMTLQQTIPFAALGLTTNDVLRLTYAYQAVASTNLVVKLQVTYSPTNLTPSISSFKVSNTSGLYQSHQSEVILKSQKVKSVKVIVKHKSKSGKSYLDRMRLIHISVP